MFNIQNYLFPLKKFTFLLGQAPQNIAGLFVIPIEDILQPGEWWVIDKELRKSLLLGSGFLNTAELLQQSAMLLFSNVPTKQELWEVLMT